MRYEFKALVVSLAHLLTWPLTIPSIIHSRLFRSEGVYDFFSKLISIIPGKPGQYIRASFYMQTLQKCHYDLVVGFCSFFSHPNAEVGRGVKIGSFSIVGTVILEDNVIIASRVSVLSGKYQHGGGPRGRDIKNNSVHYQGVRIGRGSWLGEGCIVMADIEDGCIVSAGSVVTKIAPAQSTAIGNPARFLRYEEVKNEIVHI